MQLTEHFTLEELLTSQSAVRLGYDEQFAPPESIKENLKELCEKVLEPIRVHLNASIHISSGYRCERVNSAIGGVNTSQHCKGQAVDMIAQGKTVEEVYQFIKSSGVIFDQCIQEFDHWVHISFTGVGVNRMQCLRAIKVDGVTKYIPDISV